MKKVLFSCLIPVLWLIMYPIQCQVWNWSNPKPTGNLLYSFYFANSTTGYIAGQCGTILKTIDGGTSWANLNSGTTYDLYGLSFLDANTGWVVGDYGIILKTIDGGETWIDQSMPWTSFYSVYFVSPMIGYICGSINFNGGHIFKTVDGGNTWNELSAPAVYYPQYVHFISTDIGFYGGEDNFNNGIMLRTIDGGITWNTCWSTTNGNCNYSMSFTDMLNGFAVCRKGILLKTADGGATWSPLTTGTTKDLYSVFFVNALTGFVGGDEGVFLKTTDGGVTWSLNTLDPEVYLWGIWYTDINNGYILSNGITSSWLCKIYKTTNGGNSFNNLVSGTRKNLRSVFFPLSNTGIVVGDSGVILKTTDAGNSWTMLTTGDTSSLNSVVFPSPTIGFAVGRSGKILKTADGGSTWTVEVSGTNQPLHSVTFYDDNTGYVAGDWGTVLKTTNGGSTWTSQNTGTSRYLYGISIADATTLYAVGSWGTIIKSTDGGNSWATILSGVSTINYYSVYFNDQYMGYVSGDNGKVMKTTDGGSTWTPCDMNGNSEDIYNSIIFSDASIGYAVGMESNPHPNINYGLIKLTTDGGQTWISQFSGTRNELHNVCINGSNAGFAVGDYGSIINTVNGGVGISLNTKVSKLRIFPNPTTDLINIKFPFVLKVGELTIISPYGMELMKIQISGQEIQVDISNLTSGLYFVRVTDNKTSYVEKLIKE